MKSNASFFSTPGGTSATSAFTPGSFVFQKPAHRRNDADDGSSVPGAAVTITRRDALEPPRTERAARHPVSVRSWRHSARRQPDMPNAAISFDHGGETEHEQSRCAMAEPTTGRRQGQSRGELIYYNENPRIGEDSKASNFAYPLRTPCLNPACFRGESPQTATLYLPATAEVDRARSWLCAEWRHSIAVMATGNVLEDRRPILIPRWLCFPVIGSVHAEIVDRIGAGAMGEVYSTSATSRGCTTVSPSKCC